MIEKNQEEDEKMKAAKERAKKAIKGHATRVVSPKIKPEETKKDLTDNSISNCPVLYFRKSQKRCTFKNIRIVRVNKPYMDNSDYLVFTKKAEDGSNEPVFYSPFDNAKMWFVAERKASYFVVPSAAHFVKIGKVAASSDVLIATS